MEPCRLMVAGAIILNCILGTSAAVLKVSAVADPGTLETKFSDGVGNVHQLSAVDGPQSMGGIAAGNFKRSLIDSGIGNVAYPANFQFIKGNPRVDTEPGAPVTNRINLETSAGQSGATEATQPLTSATSVSTGQLVTVSSKFSREEAELPGSSRHQQSSSRGISALESNDGVIRSVPGGQIVSIGAKFSPEEVQKSGGSNQQAPAAGDIIQITHLGVDGTSTPEVTDTDNEQAALTAETPMGDREAMNLTFYETIASDNSTSDVRQVSESVRTNHSVASDTVVSEVTAQIDYRESTAPEGTDDHVTGVETTTLQENLQRHTSETVLEVYRTPFQEIEETTESETTTLHRERLLHPGMRDTVGPELDAMYYQTHAQQPSEQDNEVWGDQVDVDFDVDTGDCSRPCEVGAPPRVCKFTFHVEWYHTMSKACFDCPNNASSCDLPHCVPADGIDRPIIVANRQMPGPTVSVCVHDIVQVDVVNGMTEETTSVHWHGQHQRGSPHMDGVPFVTQCPIGPASAFRYRFVADTPGTHFWHSHTGCQRADGLYGAMIVRTPGAVDPHARLYDEEGPVLQLADWGRPLGVDKFVNHHHAAGDNKPTSILVNGRGGLHWAHGQPGPPPAHFTVKQGKRYRFRVINNGFLNCPIQMSVDGHSLLVISSDGADIDPVGVESLVTYAGERWDFVLEASAPVSNYWIRFQGLMDCGAEFTKAHQVAVLRYHGAAFDVPAGNVSWEDNDKPGLSLNALNAGPDTPGALVVSELTASRSLPDDFSLAPKPDRTFYLGYDFYAIDNPHYHHPKYYGMSQMNRLDHKLFTPQFNHLSLKLPSFPLLSQFSDLDESTTCNETTMADQGCEAGYCECLHMLRVPLGAVVEIVLVDEGNMYNANHPFHLHGHAFRVVAMGKLGSNTSVEEVRALDTAGGIKRKLRGAPIKDTVTVPDGGYTVLRVNADNPGYWLFHCHIEFHVEVGMAVVFKVGEHSDFPAAPPGFPRCNSWLPPYPSKGQSLARLTATGADALQHTQGPSSAPRAASTSVILLLLASLLLAGASLR